MEQSLDRSALLEGQPRDDDVGPEWRALELLGTGLPGEAEERFQEILSSPGFHFGELFEQAMRHRIFPLLAHHLTQERCLPAVDRELRFELFAVLDRNRKHVATLKDEAVRIAEALDARGVPHVCTKGLSLASTLYPDGARAMNDADFMIRPSDRDLASEIMRGRRYTVGGYDWSFRKPVPLPRKYLVMFKMHDDHLPHFTRANSGGGLPYISVDFALSLTWKGSQWQIPVDDALADRRPIATTESAFERLRRLAAPFEFLFTALHLFREAWFERTIRAKDVTLAKFFDVIRLWDASDARERSGIAAAIERYGVQEPLGWVAAHTDRTFGTTIVRDLRLDSTVSDAWLQSARAADGRLLTWEGTMRNRLRLKRRPALIGADAHGVAGGPHVLRGSTTAS